MYKYLLLIIICFSPLISSSQYSVEMQKAFGTTSEESARTIVSTYDGGYVLAGYSKIPDENTYLKVLKISPKGEVEWKKTFKEHFRSEAYSIIETNNQDLLIAGDCIKDGEYSSDIWIIKLNTWGNLIWEKTFDGRANGNDGASQIIKFSDDTYAVSGYTYGGIDFAEDMWFLIIDEEGNKIWDMIYGGGKEDRANAIARGPDSTLILTGYTNSYGLYKRQSLRSIWVVKVNMNKDIIWDKTLGISQWDEAVTMTQTYDQGIALAGYTRDKNHIDNNIIVYKLDKAGNEVWHRVIDKSEKDQASQIIETTDKGLAIAGNTILGNERFNNFWLIKLNDSGELIWDNVFSRKSLEFAYDIIETKDKGVAMAGATQLQNDLGWQFAILKYKNENRPRIHFVNPVQSKTITTETKYTLQIEFQSVYSLNNVIIYNNDNSVLNWPSLKKIVKKETDSTYIAHVPVYLQPGKNNIHIEAENDGGTEISSPIEIHNIDIPPVIW